MTVLPAILTGLCGLTTLIWLGRNVALTRERRSGVILREGYRGQSSEQPRINVYVAAKDEQANIERCARTMLDQDYPNFDMTVCNDRSTDRTGEIVAGIAGENPRLRLLNITHLPEGWAGKNNAMNTGIAQGDAPWICMIDADCWQVSRRTLSAAMAYAQDTGADLLSVLPTHELTTFWENVVMPICSGVMMIWFDPSKVNNPRKSNAYANGAFMLIRREAYLKAGGHEAVRTCVNEDMHMADRLKRGGMNLRVVRNDGLYSLHMYDSFRAMYRGWSRIFYGTFGTFKRITLSLLAVLIVSMQPYAAAAMGFALYTAGDARSDWWLACGIAGAAAVTMQLVAVTRFFRLIRARWWTPLTYLLGCGFAMCCLVSALGKLRKGAKIVWRNTAYNSDQAATQQASSPAGSPRK